MKVSVALGNTFKLKDLKDVTRNGFLKVKVNTFAKAEEKVIRIEQDFMRTSGIIEATVDPLIIRLGESSSDESDHSGSDGDDEES